MSFNHFDKNYYLQEFASPGESNILQIFNHQAQKIKELEEKIESHNHDLTTLITQINLQGPSTSQSNPSIKSKGKQPQTLCSSLANNQTRPPRDIASKKSARISNIPSKIPCQLKALQYQFGVANNFPQHYLKILSDPDAHSKDKVDPVTKKNTIKRVACNSEKANLFMCRLDEEMEKADQANRSKTPKHVKDLPVNGIGSISQTIPNGLPMDFYDPEWFNNQTACQKRIFSDLYKVAFLPNATKSLLGKPHPDERLSYK
ncbi:hypothetical protein O181_090267 [Austropuccinia psidii MF-1]|uniref:Uncharacterized protein n=1 Tax=Austropuccinia psidii MF-1 TaxID=1389203 RepID=A0A9Q3P7I3_9BASI|nr:hypothetical protein [Austropuccinia psidii MF-1]